MKMYSSQIFREKDELLHKSIEKVVGLWRRVVNRGEAKGAQGVEAPQLRASDKINTAVIFERWA
jgi:hypothetical protein